MAVPPPSPQDLPMHADPDKAAPADAHGRNGNGHFPEMPLPQDPKTVFLGILCLLALTVALYVARDIVLPIVLAVVLKLLLQPLVRLLEKARIPRAIGAIAAILLLLAIFAGIGALLTSPAAEWAGNLSNEWSALQAKFAFIADPLHQLQERLEQMGVHFGGAGTLLEHPTDIVTAVFAGTSTVASHLFETLLILFYLLVFGDIFLRRFVEILPNFMEKREAVSISLRIEHDLSAYLLTVTVINAVVGVATALVMWACGIPAPVLWGAVAFCLNFVPILGPFFGVALFLAVGLVAEGPAWIAILPAALYLGIHVAEGEWITPMVLARRFTINPVAVILALIFWYWMWGVPGAILAVPMLAITKIVCDRLRPLRALGHLLEG
ncbi:AI-2E family transporter [Inquilinus sp. OTU3971]|uniref:AI-2E family transporter n=1 Tax=Inquilinus sp. OTU3971 TaxID=3043855 RepID=UPI00313EE81A